MFFLFILNYIQIQKGVLQCDVENNFTFACLKLWDKKNIHTHELDILNYNSTLM